MTSIYTIWFYYHGKNQENPPSTRRLCQCQPKGFSSLSCYDSFQPSSLGPPRAPCPQACLTQDQRGEQSRSRISAIVASKATKPADDSRDDDEDNDKEEVQSIGKKGNDDGDDKQGVKEGGVLAAAKAAKPGGDDSKDDDDDDDKEGQKGVEKCIMGWKGGKKRVINDGDNDNVDNDDVVWGKGGKKHVIDDGDNEDDDDDSVEGGSSLSLSDEVVTWVLFNLSYVNYRLHNL